MPKRRVDIQTFAGLSSPSLDDEDVPLDGASFATDLDPTERPGRLRGFHDDETVGVSDRVVAQAALDGGDTIVYYDGSDLKTLTGAGDGIDQAATGTIASVSSPVRPQLVSDGERVYMARGPETSAKWIGKFQRLHPHDDALLNGFQVRDADMKRPKGLSLTKVTDSGSDSDNLPEGSIYRFAISYTYDGFQEGPLRVLQPEVSGNDWESITLKLDWTQTGDIQTPKRVTHHNLYVIANPADASKPLETGTPKLITTLAVDDSSWSAQLANDGLNIQDNENWVSNGEIDNIDAWGTRSESQEASGYEDYDIDAGTLDRSIDLTTVATQTDVASAAIDYQIDAREENGGYASASVSVEVRSGDGTVLDSASASVDTDASDSVSESGTLTVTGWTVGNEATLHVTADTSANTTNDGEEADAGSDIVSIYVTTSDGTGGNIFATSIEWAGTPGQSYQQRTGFSPTDEQPEIAYAANAGMSGFHFVTGSNVDGEKYRSYVFRSKAKRFSQFAWAQDYMNLDTEVHTLQPFNGRLWAFSASTAYIIDPRTLSLERSFEGKGALGPTAITRSPMGLFWASGNNLHLYDGRELRDVGGPILDSDVFETKVWSALDTSVTPTTWYSPAENLLVAAYREDGGSNGAWMLHLPDQRWTDAIPGPRWMHLSVPSGGLDDAFLGADGEAYFSIGGTLYRFATADSRKPWTWISKRITLDAPSVVKVFYHADVKGDPVTLEYREDQGAWQMPARTSETTRHRWPINSKADGSGPWEGVYDLRIRLSGEGSDEVSSLSMLARMRSRTR